MSVKAEGLGHLGNSESPEDVGSGEQRPRGAVAAGGVFGRDGSQMKTDGEMAKTLSITEARDWMGKG